jgi:c(7)-type cytochrome triheme protein
MPQRPHKPRRPAAVLLCLAATAFIAFAAWAAPELWQRLEKDGVHDPRGPAIGLLQQPAEALEPLPRDTAGNLVNWVRAIDSGAINPRTNILPETKVRVLDQDIIIAKYGSMPAVKFPHRQHTLWLDCTNCHDQLFIPRIGANRFSMTAILNGEQCGLCHGAVSFPLTECNRCHSVPNSVVRAAALAAAAAAASAPSAASTASAPKPAR